MSYYSLWIDTAHAYVYKFTPNGVEETKIEAHGSKEHAHESTDKFYHEVAGKLVNAKELMIMDCEELLFTEIHFLKTGTPS